MRSAHNIVGIKIFTTEGSPGTCNVMHEDKTKQNKKTKNKTTCV